VRDRAYMGVWVVVFRVENLPRDLHATDGQMGGGNVGLEGGGSRAGSGVCGRVGGCFPSGSSPKGLHASDGQVDVGMVLCV